MKKNLLFLALALVALSASAQQNQTPAEQPAAIVAQPALRFGYFSFEQVFHTMPGYAIAKHNMDELRAKYDEETKRVETEFNTKYEEFLDGQRSYAKTILEKRQAELRELMEKNIAFKAEARRLLAQAETDAMAPLREQINELLQQVAKDMQLAFVLNTGSDACPYVNPAMSVDITDTLIDLLKKRR